MARNGIAWALLLAATIGELGCSGQAPPAAVDAGPAAEAAVERPTPPVSPGEAPKATPAPVARASGADSRSAVSRIEVSPNQVMLAAGDQGTQLLAWQIEASGARHDVTALVTWSVEPPGVVSVDRGGYVRPMSGGEATLRADLPQTGRSVAVRVAGLERRPWDFGEDVVPLLTHAGCNTGGCHGRAEGQNGFHLSLFGYDDDGDYRALTHEAAGRRLSPLAPEASLLLRKATGRTPHAGGPRLSVDSVDYRTLAAWIGAGAPRSEGACHGVLKQLVVEPGDVRLDNPGPQQLRVVAEYADGHRRDVTRLSSFRSLDDSIVTIDPNGRATVVRRGEADVVIRYKSHVTSTRLATPLNREPVPDLASRPRKNFVDELLFKRLASLNVPASPTATDAAFLRRVSLDLTGEQPLPEAVRAFLADSAADKRTKLIDRLLASREFVLFWRIKLGDLLQISSSRLGNGAPRFQAWVDDCLARDTPWDVMVRAMLTSVGRPDDNVDGGPVNYALDGPDAKTRAEQTAQRFLGIRLRCAQCHDHPFDVWTQDDYYGLAACFAKVERSGGGGMMGRTIVRIDPKGRVEHLRTQATVEPRLLDGTPVRVAEAEDPRQPLAAWITSPQNPYFARAMANWVWAQLFGKGLADPPDDLSRSNPPVHPELLDALGQHFVDGKYSLRQLIRTIAVSEAYGLSSAPVPGNEGDLRLFSHHLPRPLSAHQMADALAQATGIPNRFPNRAKQTRAIEVADPTTASAILDTFGRCPRVVGCAPVSAPVVSLRQSLLLIGGDVISGKVGHLQGYLASLMDESLRPEPADIVENLYYRTVCRPPSAEESSHWAAELVAVSSQREVAEDLFWALLNSREFAFNH